MFINGQSKRSNQGHFLPCPVCKNSIPFVPEALIRGAGFNCTNCNCEIRLSPRESGFVNDAIEKLNSLSEKS